MLKIGPFSLKKTKKSATANLFAVGIFDLLATFLPSSFYPPWADLALCAPFNGSDLKTPDNHGNHLTKFILFMPFKSGRLPFFGRVFANDYSYTPSNWVGGAYNF